MMYERGPWMTKYKAVAGMFSLALLRAAPDVSLITLSDRSLEWILWSGADSAERYRQGCLLYVCVWMTHADLCTVF